METHALMSAGTAHESTTSRQVVLAALVLLAVALRLPLLPAALTSHDAVNFALGLEHFDLALHQPHFPGYPVYLALAWPFFALGAPAAMALALPAALASGVAAGCVALVLEREAGLAVAIAGAGIYATLPGLLVADAQPMSDGLGVHAFTMCLCATLSSRGITQYLARGLPRRIGVGSAPASPQMYSWYLKGLPEPRRRRGVRQDACQVLGDASSNLAAAFGAGVLPGIRASSLPLTLAMLAVLWLRAPAGGRRPIAVAAVAGVAVWLLPLVVLAGGPEALLDAGTRFVSGHFSSWGGTVVTAEGGGRLAKLAWNLGAFGLGPVAGVIIASLAVGMVATRSSGSHTRALLAIALPYAVWVALAQNPDKARHVLPLLPILLLACAPFAARLARMAPGAVAIGLPLAVFVSCLPRAIAARELPPALRMVAWVARHHGPEQLQVFAGEEAALLRTYAPAFRTTLVRSGQDLRRALALPQARARVVLASSGIEGLEASGLRLSPVARFTRSPLVDSHDHELVLYRVRDPKEARP